MKAFVKILKKKLILKLNATCKIILSIFLIQFYVNITFNKFCILENMRRKRDDIIFSNNTDINIIFISTQNRALINLFTNDTNFTDAIF